MVRLGEEELFDFSNSEEITEEAGEEPPVLDVRLVKKSETACIILRRRSRSFACFGLVDDGDFLSVEQ